jgi:hypothetical protein
MTDKPDMTSHKNTSMKNKLNVVNVHATTVANPVDPHQRNSRELNVNSIALQQHILTKEIKGSQHK